MSLKTKRVNECEDKKKDGALNNYLISNRTRNLNRQVIGHKSDPYIARLR